MAFYKHRVRASIALISFVTGLSASATALAQQAPPVTPPTREELDPGREPLPDDKPRLTVEGDIERSACPLANPSYRDITVDIDRVEFNNLQGISEDELRSSYAEYLGKGRPVASICDIRDAAATMLRGKGYLAAVQVPTQQIEGGTVRLEVLYARVTAIRVRGDAGPNEQTVANYLKRLTDDPLFNRFNAERYLLLARDIPGLDVRLSLRPADTGPGDLIGEVTVLRRKYEVDLNIQNLSSPETGRWGGQLRAQFYGLTGLGDRTTVSLYSTADFEEQQILQLGHEMRLGSDGFVLAGRFTYAWTEPSIAGLTAGAPKVKGDTLYASLVGTYPLVRSQSHNLRVSAGLDFVNQDVDFIGPLTRDRLRVGFIRLDADAIDLSPGRAPKWRVGGSLEFRQGFDILGASDGCAGGACGAGVTPPARFDGDPTSSLIRINGYAEYVFSKYLSVFVQPRAQLAFDPLFSFEEFSAGNFTVGRGYDPGTIIGDDGVGLQFELRGPRITPVRDSDFTFQPFAFVDTAWVWNDDIPAANDPQKLTSVGGGVKASFDNRFRLDVTLAVPTKRAGLLASKGDARLLVSLTMKLLPWRK